MMKLNRSYLIFCVFVMNIYCLNAQKIMETGGKSMPNEWIDRDTGHKVIKLTRREGINTSFYFHNTPFIGNKMIFCGGNRVDKAADISKKEIYNIDVMNLQMYCVDLNSLDIEQLTHENRPVHSEIVCTRTKEMFYQIEDSIYSLNVETKKRKLITVLPVNEKCTVSAVNADGSLLAGVISSPREMEILKENPQKSKFFDLIYEAKLPKTLFVINTKNGTLKRIYTEKAWLNHLQFSPVDPHLLLFCHEGPWHKVDRIWTIDVTKDNPPLLVHKRTMDMEIAGHEWFGSEGSHIYFDLQKPRGKTFFVGKYNMKTGKEIDYELTRDEWSVHYTTSWGEKIMAGDGGDSISVAKATNGKWIYLFKPSGKKLKSVRLVNMKNHNYNLEPNVHFSPDNKWVIFRANFEGSENVYAVKI